MRNINTQEGLCNGTRLQVVDPGKHVLRCVILTGDQTGEQTFIPQIILIEEAEFSFVLSRHQFPIRLAFASTINKSQGQTFQELILHNFPLHMDKLMFHFIELRLGIV